MTNIIIHCPTQELYDAIVEKIGWYDGKKCKVYWEEHKENTSVMVDGGKIRSFCYYEYYKIKYSDYTFTTAEEVLRTPNGGIIKDGDLVATTIDGIIYMWHKTDSIPELLETYDNVMVQDTRDGMYKVVKNQIKNNGKYKTTVWKKTEEEAKNINLGDFNLWPREYIDFMVKDKKYKILYPFNNETEQMSKEKHSITRLTELIDDCPREYDFSTFYRDALTYGTAMTYGTAIFNNKPKQKPMKKATTFLRNLALSKEDKLLRKFGIEDECGNPTEEGYDLSDEISYKANRLEIIELAKKMEADEKKTK